MGIAIFAVVLAASMLSQAVPEKATVYRSTSFSVASSAFDRASRGCERSNGSAYDGPAPLQCNQTEPLHEGISRGARTVANWTYMTYMAGDSDLWEEAYDDINEMEDAGSTDDLNIIVLFDADGGGGAKPNDSNLYRITYDKYLPLAPDWYDRTLPKSPIVDTLGEVVPLAPANEVDMSDPETLIKFINFTITHYPAKHYLLDLWDHGDGLGTCRDKGSWLTIGEIDYALNAALAMTGLDKFDIIAFDSCVMGRFEVAYQVRNYTDIVMYSEKNDPSDGMPYDEILAALKANTAMEPEALAALSIDEFVESYINVCDKSITFSALNTSRIGELARAVDALSAELAAILPHYHDEIATAYNGVETYEGKRFADLYHFAELLEGSISSTHARELAEEVMACVNATVIAEGHWTNTWANDPADHAHGTTIFLPTWPSSMSWEYLNLHFCIDTSWNEFVNAYLTGAHDCKFSTNLTTIDRDFNNHTESAMLNYSTTLTGDLRVSYEIFRDGELVHEDIAHVSNDTYTGTINFSAVDYGNYTFALFLEEYISTGWEVVDCALIPKVQLENGDRDLVAQNVVLKRGDGKTITNLLGASRNESHGNITAVEGDVISLCAEVHNSGAIDSFGIEVAFYIDDAFEGVVSVDILKGEKGYPAIKWNATKGTHTVRFVIDPQDRIEEYNESNNNGSLTFVVRANAPSSVYRIFGFVFDSSCDPILYADVVATNKRTNLEKRIETGIQGLGFEVSFNASKGEYLDSDIVQISVSYAGISAEKNVMLYSEDQSSQVNLTLNISLKHSFSLEYIERGYVKKYSEFTPTLRMKNTGNTYDEVALEPVGVPEGWKVKFSKTVLKIKMGSTQPFTMTVILAENASIGDSIKFAISARSLIARNVSLSSNVTLVVVNSDPISGNNIVITLTNISIASIFGVAAYIHIGKKEKEDEARKRLDEEANQQSKPK